MNNKSKLQDTPDKHPGFEPPIKESSEQQGMAPASDERDKLMPIGKPGIHVKEDEMSENRDEWISKRAYVLWEDAGRPDGHDANHWEQASLEYDDQHLAEPDSVS
jgi:hypothetical protein